MIIDRYKKIQTGVVVGLLFAFLMILSPILCMASDETKDRTGEDTSTASIASALIEKQAGVGGIDTVKSEIEKYIDEDSFEILGEFSTDEFIKDVTAGKIGFDLKH